MKSWLKKERKIKNLKVNGGIKKKISLKIKPNIVSELNLQSMDKVI